MPAKSKKQQMAAAIARAAKRKRKKISELGGASRRMYKSLSGRELEDLAKTKRKRLPKRARGAI